MKILIIDNYDSFTYNLYQHIGELLEAKKDDFILEVARNDRITISQIKRKKYDKIIISPGPGEPGNAKYFGVCSKVILEIGKKIPILGVCLGLQGIAYCFGGRVVKAKIPMHGKQSKITHDGRGIFKGLPQELEVMRYHSLVAEKAVLPEVLEISALSNGEIMGLRHKKFPIEGIQFHPESFATEGGKKMLTNFLFTK